MTTVVLVIHVLIAIALIITVLLQRSEGGALGIGGGGGMSGFLTGRATANVLTRTTAILAACFMITSVTLAILAVDRGRSKPIIQSTPPASGAPAAPAEPAAPEAPAAPQR
ncbi:MAG: preprotein translocase subunit SecG [Alphaproteobacteria bacterium]